MLNSVLAEMRIFHTQLTTFISAMYYSWVSISRTLVIEETAVKNSWPNH